MQKTATFSYSLFFFFHAYTIQANHLQFSSDSIQKSLSILPIDMLFDVTASRLI